jgi:hypothetical protein
MPGKMLSSVYLTMLAGPVPLPVPKPVVDAVTSVQVTTRATDPSGFQISFTLADSSPLQALFLLAPVSPVMQIRVVLFVTMNYLPQVLIDGIMTHHQIEPGGQSGYSTLTISGEDLTAVMKLITLPGLPFPAMTAEARVAAILAKYAAYGVVPEIIPSIVPDISIPVQRMPTQKGNDYDYLKLMADAAGYVFYVDPGPLPGMSRAYWGPEIKFGIPQQALNVNQDTWTNVDSLHFSYEPDKSTLPIVFIQDPMTKAPIPIIIPPVTPLNPPLGLFVPVPPNVEVMSETSKLDPGQALMQGMARASRSADVVSGIGTLDVVRYGQILKARQLVGVRGAGPAFDGLHYVDSVTHNLAKGEYKQSFTLKRNALIANTPIVPTMGI